MEKLFKVILCDDCFKNIHELSKCWKKYPDVQITAFTDPKEAFACNETFDAAILDIEIGDASGLELAAHFFDINPNCIIVFYTNFSNYAIAGYGYHAYRYILKTEPDELKMAYIDEIYEECTRRNEMVKVFVGNKSTYIFLRDVYFVESIKNTIFINTKKGNLLSRRTLKSFIAEYKNCHFIQTHKSYLVNAEKIVSFTPNKEIILKNGESVPVGRKYSPGVSAYLGIS